MASKGQTSDRILGSLRSADGKGVIHIEERYDTGIDDLWSAPTDPSRLARWYGDIDGDLRPGGEFNEHLEPAGLHAEGRVEVCEPPQRLRVVSRETEESWEKGDGPAPFDTTIEATLTAVGDQTLLVIEAQGMPLGNLLAAYGVGYQIHAENLGAYLAGQAAGDTGSRWGELIPAYAEMAATIE